MECMFFLLFSSVGFFFFQAEDGIRDDLVTGVQTCALPIYFESMRDCCAQARAQVRALACPCHCPPVQRAMPPRDRKSTRLNSSHQIISYAVFCLKKKKQHSATHSSYQYSLHPPPRGPTHPL